MSRHIGEKIGKKINTGNTYSRIPKKKGNPSNFQEKVEGAN
jgi:hypothetical protein